MSVKLECEMVQSLATESKDRKDRVGKAGWSLPLVNRHALYLPMLPRQIANFACSGHGHVAGGGLTTLVRVQVRHGAAAITVHGHGLIVEVIT